MDSKSNVLKEMNNTERNRMANKMGCPKNYGKSEI